MFFIISLFLISFLSSCVIVYIRKYTHNGSHAHDEHYTFAFLDDFTDGIFLGIGVFDLAPHALSSSHHLGLTQMMTVGIIALCVALMSCISYAYTALIRGDNKGDSGVCCLHDIRPNVFIYWPILVLLAIHSLFEGIALGIIIEPVYQWILFSSIALHKGLESIAFSNAAIGAFKKAINAYILIAIFASLTPMGIYAGGQLMLYHPHHESVAVYLNIISSAMFIYMGLSCILVWAHHSSNRILRPSLLGLCLVSAVSVFSEHPHDHSMHDSEETVD